MKTLYIRKTALLCLFTIAFGLSVHAQQSKTISLNNFTGVAVSAGIELLITQGSTESAKIVAEKDIIDEVVVQQSGSTVNVKWKQSWGINKMWKNKSAKVYITYKKLNSISASSGSSVKTQNTLKTGELETAVSSGASINANISCNNLQVTSSSGASINLNGTATNVEVSSSSGSSVDAMGLASQYARVSTSSGAGVEVNVAKGLETTTSSGGSIQYKGAAALKNNSAKHSGVSKVD